MSVSASRRQYTLDDYLDVEEASSVRHEFLDGEIFALAGGIPEHAALAGAVVVSLGLQLRGSTCRPYSADLRIRVLATGLATYADAAVICGEIERDPKSPTHATNPTVIVEVLSKSTEAYDRGEKREHYQQIESLREYVLVEHDRRAIAVFARPALGAPWSSRRATAGDVAKLPALGVEISVDELYDAAAVLR